MTTSEILAQDELLIIQTVNQAIKELKKSRLLNDAAKTPFQKVEYLLYNYSNFEKGIQNKREKITDIKNHGLGQKSKSITSFGGFGDNKTQEEKEREQIQDLRKSISTTEKCIDLIDEALKHIEQDIYKDLIRLWYFEDKKREDIALYFGVDESTISRNKSRLINKLKIILFSDEVLREIFNVS